MGKVYVKVCRTCGDCFNTTSKSRRICDVCQTFSKIKPSAAGKKRGPDALDKMMREIREYNERHGTSLSYGQYVMKFGR